MKLPNFSTKKEKFNYLVKNKKELIELKKATMKSTDCFGGVSSEESAIKLLNTNYKDDVASGQIKRTIIGNTYNWMDSHDDVHLDGLFSKSISERKDKIFHLHDHEYKLTSKVGTPQNIYEKVIFWLDLGINVTGQTMALMMDSNIEKNFNPQIFSEYLKGEIKQHSVGMVYQKLDLAINDPDEKEAFAVWNKVINKLGNKEKALEQGYFWAITEAKLIEISCVLEGSNELTPTITNESKLPPIHEVKSINYEYLVNNLK